MHIHNSLNTNDTGLLLPECISKNLQLADKLNMIKNKGMFSREKTVYVMALVVLGRGIF